MKTQCTEIWITRERTIERKKEKEGEGTEKKLNFNDKRACRVEWYTSFNHLHSFRSNNKSLSARGSSTESADIWMYLAPQSQNNSANRSKPNWKLCSFIDFRKVTCIIHIHSVPMTRHYCTHTHTPHSSRRKLFQLKLNEWNELQSKTPIKFPYFMHCFYWHVIKIQ